MTFIDDYSRWCVVKMLKRKSEVFEQYKVLVENTGHKIKYLQLDNGKEYVNQEFDTFLRNNGIERRLTVMWASTHSDRHTPEQNGIAEKKNRTLVEMARCLMIQSNLSSSFWGEVINTANYIRNRCPTSSLNGKTPQEKWAENIPNVEYFQEFDCQAYSLNRELNKEKFQSRSKKGTLSDVENSKVYRIWIPEKRRIDILRDIKFITSTGALDGEYEDLESKEEITIDRWREFKLPKIGEDNENLEDEKEDPKTPKNKDED